MNTILWILSIILILIITSRLAKIVFDLDNYLSLFILLRTKHFVKFLDKLAKPKKFLDSITNIGIVIGFGAFGLDYIIKKNLKSKIKRIFLFVVSSIIFSLITYFLAKKMIIGNPMISVSYGYLIIILTGIMGLSGFTLGSLIFSAGNIISKLFVGKVACPGVGPVIPGVKIPKVGFFIPWYGWIILVVSAIIHEFSHGALLRKLNIKIKSLGFILAAILPLGAFVEPDEKQVEKVKKRKIINMYAAGPTSNMIIAAIFFIILLIISSPISNYTKSIDSQREIGIVVSSVTQNTEICGSVFNNPAYGKLDVNDLIISINGKNINSRADLSSAIDIHKENKFIVKNLNTNKEKIEYIKPNSLGRLGITVSILTNKNFIIPKKYFFLKKLLAIIYWIALLNFLIASVNFLPTIPFDGGVMSQIIFSDYIRNKKTKKKKMKMVAKFFGTIIIILLLLNIIPYFL